LYYRDPAFLLTTNLRGSTKQLLHIYFDGRRIEVTHREGTVTSAPKPPVLAVAAFSALLLASLKAFGAERGAAYAKLPRWRNDLLCSTRSTSRSPILNWFGPPAA
jgi:hypothetical protein